MMPNISKLLSAAIANKRRAVICYKDQSQHRIIEPHILYRTKSNRLIVESYQVRGHSSSGRVPPFWRPFQLKKIATLKLLDEFFDPRVVEGFLTIEKLVTGEIISVADVAASEYSYFNSGIYGPPRPEGWGDVTRRLRHLG